MIPQARTPAPINAMTYLLIRHRVADFATWKPVYDAHALARAAAGLTDVDLLRELDDPNQIVLLFEVSDLQKAKEFADSPSLRDAMRNAGVIDKPDLYFLER
jgi:hypothetical protein